MAGSPAPTPFKFITAAARFRSRKRTRGRRIRAGGGRRAGRALFFQTAIALLAGLYMLDMVATLFLIPELTGVELE